MGSVAAVDSPSLKRAGALLFLGTVQFLFCFVLAEVYYPGTTSPQTTSATSGPLVEVGVCKLVQPPSAIFNSSVLILGIALFVGSYYIRKGSGSTALSFFLLLSGIGAVGVEAFNEATAQSTQCSPPSRS